MALTEKQIREKIFAIIQEVCPDAKQIFRNPYTQERSTWIGAFSHEVETSPGVLEVVVHAWIVWRSGIKKAVKGGFDQMIFEVVGFHGYNFGTQTENTEDKWQQKIDELADKFADKQANGEDPIWEFEGEEDEVTTEEVNFPHIGLVPAGQTAFVHIGAGRLVVNIHPC